MSKGIIRYAIHHLPIELKRYLIIHTKSADTCSHLLKLWQFLLQIALHACSDLFKNIQQVSTGFFPWVAWFWVTYPSQHLILLAQAGHTDTWMQIIEEFLEHVTKAFKKFQVKNVETPQKLLQYCISKYLKTIASYSKGSIMVVPNDPLVYQFYPSDSTYSFGRRTWLKWFNVTLPNWFLL